MEENLSSNVLNKIKEEKIKPKSRWHFVLQDYVVWFMFFISIVLGSLSLSVILYLLQINDWGFYGFISSDFITFVFMTLPYFWIVVFPIFLLISYHYFKNTSSGYRFEFVKIASLNIGISIFLGVSFFALGIGRITDDLFIRRADFYRDIMVRGGEVWHNPESGSIVGRIKIVNDDTFELSGMRGEKILVVYSNARVEKGVVIEEGEIVKVFGDKSSQDGEFVAKEVRFFLRPEKIDGKILPELLVPVTEIVK